MLSSWWKLAESVLTYVGLPLSFVVLKIHTVVTKLQRVLCDPLTRLLGTVPALCCNSRYYSVITTNINLKPLVNVTCASAPRC